MPSEPVDLREQTMGMNLMTLPFTYLSVYSLPTSGTGGYNTQRGNQQLLHFQSCPWQFSRDSCHHHFPHVLKISLLDLFKTSAESISFSFVVLPALLIPSYLGKSFDMVILFDGLPEFRSEVLGMSCIKRLEFHWNIVTSVHLRNRSWSRRANSLWKLSAVIFLMSQTSILWGSKACNRFFDDSGLNTHDWELILIRGYIVLAPGIEWA